jgi:hypothetical protein
MEINGKKKDVRIPDIRKSRFNLKNLSFLRNRMNTSAKPESQVTDFNRYNANDSIILPFAF